MIDFKRILFPVDMSDEDRKAVPFVKAMADWFGSQIHMLYVEEFIYPICIPEDVTGAAYAAALDYRKGRQAEFDSFLATEFAQNTVHRALADGNAAREIVCYAKANDIGLIMMPTHGYGGFRRFLLGSVTAKVLHDAACPVLTGVHTPELHSEDPIKCDRLLCAVDIQPPEVRVVRWAAEFAARRRCEVQLVHAVQGAHDKDDESDEPFREFLFKSAHEAIESLQKEAGTAFPVCVRGGKPEHVVHDVAQDLGADLVMIGRGELNHPLGRLRTHTYSIIRESPRPVISV